jgi:hypothetical protein
MNCRNTYLAREGHICAKPSTTLADLKIDKKTSMLAQRVANLSPEKFKDVQASTYSPCSESCSGMSGEMGGNLGKLGEGLKGLSPSVHAVMLMFS